MSDEGIPLWFWLWFLFCLLLTIGCIVVVLHFILKFW